MNNQEILQEMKEFVGSRNFFQGLSSLTKLDLNKEFTVIKLDKPFTLLSVFNKLGKDFDNVYCLVARHDSFRMVKVIGRTDFTYDIFHRCYHGYVWRSGIEQYYRKADFNDDRKKSELAYVVAFNDDSKKVFKRETIKEIDYRNENLLLDRFKAEDDRSYNRNYYVIGQNSNNYAEKRISSSVSLTLDKSGYCTDTKKHILRKQVEEMKRNNNKLLLERYIKEGKYTKLREDFEKTQNDIRQKLIFHLATFEFNKNDTAILGMIENVCFRLKLDQISTNLNPHDFRSIEELENRFANSTERITDCYNKYMEKVKKVSSLT